VATSPSISWRISWTLHAVSFSLKVILAHFCPSQKQYPGPVAAALTDYESDSTGLYTEIIGQEVNSINNLPPHDVLVRLPADKYAKFRVEGTMPQIVMEAWSKVWQAEKDDTLKRAYTTDLERYPEPGVVELYISVA
jgi:predicted transcriptional regulator YdeE